MFLQVELQERLIGCEGKKNAHTINCDTCMNGCLEKPRQVWQAGAQDRRKQPCKRPATDRQICLQGVRERYILVCRHYCCFKIHQLTVMHHNRLHTFLNCDFKMCTIVCFVRRPCLWYYTECSGLSEHRSRKKSNRFL